MRTSRPSFRYQGTALAKVKTTYLCQECGAVFSKWSGKCTECGEWNTIVEESVTEPGGYIRENIITNASPLAITASDTESPPRISTGIVECDRVLGGGVVPGSLTLFGGDPGIGKSTLMLQISRRLAESHGPVLYVSGEESFEQTRLRARRLDVLHDNLFLLTETAVDGIRKQAVSEPYCALVIDSIQSVYSSHIPAVPGSASQLRECANEFLRLAKGNDLPVFLVGHVTKEGVIAGPKLLEHLVDTVLYFEGEGKQSLRILRGVKNRFGSTNEIGVFEMTEAGLQEVSNPSALFLSERPKGVSGSVVLPSMEGTRPLLVEVQALVSDSHLASPRRTVTGINASRVSLLLAVLEKRAGLHFADKDVFVNVAGGVRLEEPAADLAVGLALASSLRDTPVQPNLAAFGEVGLSGEVRAVGAARTRVNEASKFGFTTCILPNGCAADLGGETQAAPIAHVAEAIDIALEG